MGKGLDRLTWDPDSYMAFADLRSRPGLELIARINHPNPEVIVDLGCGPGHLTAVLARRWPDARIVGIDDSAEMLERAASQFPSQQWPTIKWQHAEIATWVPSYPVSIVFSNAALHWLGNHQVLLPHLLSLISIGGVLAVQMPDNWDQPSHRQISRLVDDPRWRSRTAPVFLGHPVADPAEYRSWLRPLAVETRSLENDLPPCPRGSRRRPGVGARVGPPTDSRRPPTRGSGGLPCPAHRGVSNRLSDGG